MYNSESQVVAPSLVAIMKPKMLHRGVSLPIVPTTSTIRQIFQLDSTETLVAANVKDAGGKNLNDSIITFGQDIEKQKEQHTKGEWYSNVRYTYLNTYRRLFSVVFIGNLIGFLIVWLQHRSLLNFVNGAAVNMLVCGLSRQPLVLNSFYSMACRLPRTTPLRWRVLAAKVFHFGGVHSGTGVAAAFWYMSFIVFATYRFTVGSMPQNGSNISVLIMSYVVLVLLLATIMVSYPTFRMKYHDWFESVHRFSVWLIVLIFWPLLFTFASQQDQPVGRFLIVQPSFWIVMILTVAVIQPWLMLRKVPVIAEPLSKHAIRLHFSFTGTKFGQGISVARHPLKDWHAFAGFPDHFDHPSTKFSLVVSRVGDFTSDVIDNPPKFIWKRSIPVYGFGKVMCLFHRIVLVTTGSGIGPCLSFLGDENRPKMRLLWVTPEPTQRYGKRILNLVHRMDSAAIVQGSRDATGRRRDIVPDIIQLYTDFKAEAVCVISNAEYTKHLVFELERRGIIAMGPIFDS